MTLTTTTPDLTTTTVLTVEAAESLTEDIRKAGANVVSARKALAKAIKAAKAGDAATVLGFASWTAYVAHVFSVDAMPRMAKADLEYLAGFMAGEGMSSRAIAAVLGVSQSTANRMVAKAAPETEEEETEVTGTDGKTYARKAKTESEPKAEVDPITSGLNRLRKGARLLSEADTTGLTVQDIDAALAALAEISVDFKRFAASLALSRESAPVDAVTVEVVEVVDAE